MKLRVFLTLFLLLPLCVSAQVRWTSRNPSPLTIPIKAIAAGNGIYVAVSEHGTVVSSTDGINWQFETFPSSENLNNVSFAGGLFFARGTSGTIFVSSDGHFWMQRLGGGVVASGSPVGHDIVHGNGTYVGVSPYGYGSFVSSSDGTTWTVDAARKGDQIAFGAGKFIMASTPYATFSTSTDGQVWDDTKPGGIGYVSQIAFGAGRFVVRRDTELLQSADGETWTSIPGVTVTDVVFVKDRFIAMEKLTRAPYVSFDGLTWTAPARSGPIIAPSHIAGIGDAFVGFVDNALYRSTDALNWSVSGTNFVTAAIDPGVAFAQGIFLTGDGYASADGVTWTKTGAALSADQASATIVRAANDRFILLSGNAVYTSADGKTATKSADLSFTGRSVAYGNGRYVLVGENSSTGGVATSTDAVTWTDRTATVSMVGLLDVSFGRGLFVAIGQAGSIYTSTDGVAWTLRPHTATSEVFESIAFGAGRWVIAGMPSLTSTDGINWSYTETIPDGFGVAFANDTFVFSPYTASQNNDMTAQPLFGVATSSDGLHWTYRDSGGRTPRRFAFGNGSWVGAQYFGRIIQSAAENFSLAPAFNSEPVVGFAAGNEDDIVIDAPATGATPVTYKWFKGTQATAGATGASVTIANWKAASPKPSYSVVASNAYGSGLTAYRVSYQTRQLKPDDSGLGLTVVMVPGARIKLGITNSFITTPLTLGPGPRHYQWYKDGVAIPNSDAQSITVPHDVAADLDSIYTVTLTNLFGRVSFDFDLAPKVTSAPLSQETPIGATVSFTTDAQPGKAGGDLVMTWRKDGKVIATRTRPFYQFSNGVAHDTLTINNVTAADYGLYQLTVSNNIGTVSTKLFTLAPPAVSRLINVSVRAPIGTGNDVLIAGFVTAGASASPHLLIRGIGPTLATLGVASALAQPHLALVDATGATVATNDQWDVQPEYDGDFVREMTARIGAFPLAAGSRDTAIIRTASLAAAASPRFSAIQSGHGNSTGVGLIELYEFAPTADRLVNLSARARVGTGENVLIAGFVVTGTQPVKLLIRAVGPTLGGKGVSGFLPNPKLILNDSRGGEFHNNDNWNQARNLADLRAATSAVGAFALDENSLDAAMLETIEPGVYSAQVSAADGASGIGLVEIYEVK